MWFRGSLWCFERVVRHENNVIARCCCEIENINNDSPIAGMIGA